MKQTGIDTLDSNQKQRIIIVLKINCGKKGYTADERFISCQWEEVFFGCCIFSGN